MASLWEAWVDAYEQVYRALPARSVVVCPSCGDGFVRVSFTGDDQDRVAYASVWCDSCLNGILISRTRAPVGVPMIPPGLPAEERRLLIPNYRIIPPEPNEDVAGDSAVL